MNASLLMFSAMLTLTGPGADSVPLRGCLISPLTKVIEVAAQEPGILKSLEARPGVEFQIDALLGQIDDTLPKAQRLERQYDLQAAEKEASNDINVRYAEAATKVAEAELDQAAAANRRLPGTVSNAEMRRLALTLRRSELQIEQASLEMDINKLKAGSSGARLSELDAVIERRQIKAPINGMVVEVVKHAGEWVQPGDTVLKMLQLDKLKVEGFLNSKQYSRSEILGRPVKVEVDLARGRVAEFDGKIVFVSPEVQAGGEFRIWAEVLNRQENNHWLLGTGMPAVMNIQLGPGLIGQSRPQFGAPRAR